VRRLLDELEKHHWVRCDLKAPIVWVVHAVADDPAANENVVRFSWAPRFDALEARIKELEVRSCKRTRQRSAQTY
jgi:hypothetical protein